jgi:hypothetical protein
MWLSERESVLRVPVWNVLSISVVLLITSGASPALAAWDDGTKVSASDADTGDNFGCSVTVAGEVAIVGARGDDDLGADSGSAYVYRLQGGVWSEEEKLVAPDGAAGDKFGHSVSISGDLAVVGAPYDDDNGGDSGSVYVFSFNGANWVEEQKLVATDGAASDKFGYSVAICGDVVVVGAYCDDDRGSNSGAAYVFQYNGSAWIEDQKLVASNGASTDMFGGSVSVDGDMIVIGAYGRFNDSGIRTGSAYVFKYQGATWIEDAQLFASDGGDGDVFGKAVCISGDVAVIGAYADDDIAMNSGAAYVFRFDGANWVEESKLLASDGAETDEFGKSVALSGNVAVIGAHQDDDMGSASGSAYIFRFDGSSWVEETKLLASDGYWLDEFGDAVAISGQYIVVGALGDDRGIMNAGAAYIFEGTSSGQYTLSVSSSGQGSVSLYPSGGLYDAGTTVQLTANAASGWYFDHWQGDLSGSSNPATLVMTSNKSVTAVFLEEQPQQYTLSVSTSGQGSVSLYPSGGVYDAGTTVQLTANAASGWYFDHWTGSLSGSNNPTAIVMNSNKNVTAVFLQDPPVQYTLTVYASGEGSVALNPPGGQYASGTTVQLTATADAGWHFDHWVGSLGGSSNPASIVMSSNKNVTAVFVQDPPVQYTLTVYASGEGSVALNPPGGLYDAGTTVQLTANAASGWYFDHWTGSLSGSSNPASIVMSSNKSVTAVFLQDQQEQYTLWVSSTGDGSIVLNPPGGQYASGTTVQLTAVADAGWHFDHWQGALSGSINPTTVVMDSDKGVNAVFVEDGDELFVDTLLGCLLDFLGGDYMSDPKTQPIPWP